MTERATLRGAFISNLIAQVAVVASLLYVGYEIRLNTRVARAQAHQDLVSLIMSIGDPVVNEIDNVADLRTRADSGLDRLSAADRMRFIAFTNRYMNLYELAFGQHQDGLLGDDVWAGFRVSLENAFQRPGFNEYWETDRPVFGPRFVAFADSAQARARRR